MSTTTITLTAEQISALLHSPTLQLTDEQVHRVALLPLCELRTQNAIDQRAREEYIQKEVAVIQTNLAIVHATLHATKLAVQFATASQ
jgi:hypothetical protein